jgi:monoamine oxidase
MKTYNYIIIGAGISGLTIANELAKTDQDLLILEAKDRLGGRIWSDKSDEGLVFERGAELIHGKDNMVYDLAQELNLDLQRLETTEKPGSILYRIAKIIGLVIVSLNLYPKPSVDESVEQYIDRIKLLPAFIKQIFHHYAQDEESLDKVSALHFVERIVKQLKKGELYGENDFMLLDGYKQIIDYLALGKEVVLNTKVQRIDWHGDTVEVHSLDQVYRAKKLIITVPINALKKLYFAPDLPPEKLQAISSFEANDIVKVLINVPKSAILTTQEVCVIPNAKFVPIWWRRNIKNDTNDQILVGWITGEYARRFIASARDKALDNIFLELGDYFDVEQIDRTKIIVQDWQDDQDILAPYYHLKPGSSLNVFESLSKSLAGKVFFAGEATSVENGTVHGAYESAKRCVREIMKGQSL